MRALIRSLSPVDTFNMTLELAGLAECFIAMRTVMRLVAQLDTFDMNLDVTGKTECIVAMRTMMRNLTKMGQFFRTLTQMRSCLQPCSCLPGILDSLVQEY